MKKQYKCRLCGLVGSNDTCIDAFCGAVADPVDDGCRHSQVVTGNRIGTTGDGTGYTDQYVEHCRNCDAWRFVHRTVSWGGRSVCDRGMWRDAADAPLEVRM